MAFSAEKKSIKLNLGNEDYSEFVDFLYTYSALNRLNLEWFGWYSTPDASKWFERSNEGSSFKVSIYLLTEENGYFFFSNGFDEKNVNFMIDYGSNTEIWLNIIEDFERELEEKGWVAQ